MTLPPCEPTRPAAGVVHVRRLRLGGVTVEMQVLSDRSVQVSRGGETQTAAGLALLRSLGAEPEPWWPLAQGVQAAVACDGVVSPDRVLALAAAGKQPRLVAVQAGSLHWWAAWLLAHDREVQVRAALARRLATEGLYADVLAVLARDGETHVRREVAKRLTRDRAGLLAALAADEDHLVRLAVARNARTPASSLLTLAEDRHISPRIGVAENPALTARLVDLLVGQPDMRVRSALTRNPGTPVAVLQRMASGDTVAMVRQAAERAVAERCGAVSAPVAS